MIIRRPSKEELERVLSYKLALLITNNSERILIGTEDNIKRRLEGEKGAELLYDQTRPFGTLLLTLDDDVNGDWGTAVFKLFEAQEILHSSNFSKAISGKRAPIPERVAQDILSEKYDTGDPICIFVALRIWYGYWRYREERSPENCNLYLNSMQNLIRPFSYHRSYVEEQVRVISSNSIFRHTQELKSYDREQSIYRIKSTPKQECIMIDKSLIPLEKWYLSKFEKWKKYIIRCKCCNSLFLADSLRYKLCSDECKNQARINNLALRKEDEDISKVDQICINASAHWYNRLSKMKASSEWTEYDIQNYEAAKDSFLAKKREKRKEYKKGKISFCELRDWLLQQEVEAQVTLEAIRQQKN